MLIEIENNLKLYDNIFFNYENTFPDLKFLNKCENSLIIKCDIRTNISNSIDIFNKNMISLNSQFLKLRKKLFDEFINHLYNIMIKEETHEIEILQNVLGSLDVTYNYNKSLNFPFIEKYDNEIFIPQYIVDEFYVQIKVLLITFLLM